MSYEPPVWRGTWHDRHQDRAIKDLESALTSAHFRANRLRSQLAQVQGDLDSRLNRLAKAFDAFVELSDLRMDLVAFAGAAEVRHHAGAAISAISEGRPPPSAPMDVPGYWLPPAVEALQAIAGGQEEEPDALAEADRRDPRRTALFLCLVLPMMGRHTLVRPEWLWTAFGEVSERVTRTQRQLWIMVAYGGFGAAGRAFLFDRLGGALPSPTPESWLTALAPGGTAPAGDLSDDAVADQARAAAQLERLRGRCESIVHATTAGEPAQPDRSAVLLEQLISEGSPPERDLLTRARELRRTISADTAGDGTPDDPVRPLEELLLADAAAKEHLAALTSLLPDSR